MLTGGGQGAVDTLPASPSPGAPVSPDPLGQRDRPRCTIQGSGPKAVFLSAYQVEEVGRPAGRVVWGRWGDVFVLGLLAGRCLGRRGGEGSSLCLPKRPVRLSLGGAGRLFGGFRIGVGLEEQPGQGVGRGWVDSLADAYHHLGVGKGGV